MAALDVHKVLGASRLDFLDQIRALAVLSVVVHHFHSPWFLAGGGVGVGVFFAISGFLISGILLEVERPYRISVAKFVLRRVFRVMPLFLAAVLAIALGLQIVSPEKMDHFYRNLPALIFMLERPPGWLGYGVGVLWTLQYEMVFYLLSGLAVLVLGPRLGVLIFSIACLCAAGVASLTLAPGGMGRVGLSVAWFWCAQFSCGSLLAYVWRTGKLKPLLGVDSLYFVAALVVLAALALSGIQATPYTKFSIPLAASFAGTLLIAGFLLSSSYPRYLGIPQFVGKISYSIYLVHGIVLDFGSRVLHWPIREPFYFVLIVLLTSYATYTLIEKPGIRVGNWVIRKIFPQKAVMA